MVCLIDAVTSLTILTNFDPVTNFIPITILKRPTPPAREPPPAPPPVKILMNPKRHAATAQGVQAPSSQNASPAPIPAHKARPEAHVSFAIVVPPDFSPRKSARSAPKTPFRPQLMVRLPKVVIHEPVWWDQWTDVELPGTSHGKMLDVPPLNWRGKLDVEDLVHFYPEERTAEQAKRRLRQLERAKTSRREAAARRHGCSCQKTEKKARSQATPAASRSSASAAPPDSLPSSFYIL